MGKPKAPAAPDYAAAAEEQGKANVNSAIGSNYLNQVNQVGPTGSVSYSYGKPGEMTNPGTPAVYDKKGHVITPAVAPTYSQGDGMTLPDGTFIPRVTSTTTLSPEQQKLYDQNVGLSTSLNDIASKGIGYVDKATDNPITSEQFNPLKTGLAVNPLDASKYKTNSLANKIQTSYDFSKLGAMPSSSDFTADRDLVTQALMDRLKPTMDQERGAQEAKLANQGINLGSGAYSDANFNQERGFNDQKLAAVLAGSQEQQRMFQNAMGIRQQGVGEAVAQGDFNNAGVGQRFSQGLAANAQNFGQDFQGNQLNFNQGLASNQFNNQARAQAIQEADYFKNQPLNMLNALRSGNQVTMPQFGNVSGGAQIAAAPIYAATNDAYQGALQAYQSKNQLFGDIIGGVSGLGSAAIKASDRRLKENIERLGTTKTGLGIYAYNYIKSGEFDIGFMADEVEKIFPEAVLYDEDGYAMVDYGKAH